MCPNPSPSVIIITFKLIKKKKKSTSEQPYTDHYRDLHSFHVNQKSAVKGLPETESAQSTLFSPPDLIQKSKTKEKTKPTD